jgi:hypothetical protein
MRIVAASPVCSPIPLNSTGDAMVCSFMRLRLSNSTTLCVLMNAKEVRSHSCLQNVYI